MNTPFKTLITAIATVGMLALTAPALADRDDRGKDSKIRPHKQTHQQKAKHFQAQRQHGKVREARQERRQDQRQKQRHDKREDRRHDYRDRHQDKRHRGDRHDYKHKPHRPHHKPSHHKPHRPHYRKHKHHWRPAHYNYGYRWNRLPRNYANVRFGGLSFYFSDGIFYRPHGNSYVVARAPLGMVVHSLPGAAVMLALGHNNYYVAYDTYYLWDNHARGYRVVANPGFY